MVGFSFTIFLISARLFFLIDFSLVKSEEYLLIDPDCEWDHSVIPNFNTIIEMLCNNLLIHMEAPIISINRYIINNISTI